MPIDLVKCSFCGKAERQVRKLIAGPNVRICNECVALCHDIISDDSGSDAEGWEVVPNRADVIERAALALAELDPGLAAELRSSRRVKGRAGEDPIR